MLDVADALAVVLRHAGRLAPADGPLSPAALGRVLAADVTADRDSPPFAKSLRDGYAVRAADVAKGPGDLRIIEDVPAGAVPTKAVGPGQCTRLFTGAPIPDGADAVVMQEQARQVGIARVRLDDAGVKPGQWVFPRGQEMAAGDVVLPAGTPLTPAALGLLAAVGRTSASLYPSPRVGILATGDELVEADAAPGPGQIRNSNGPMLAALAARAGGTPRYLGIGRDDKARLKALVRDGLDTSDVLLLAGGVSVGDFDLVPDVLAELGVTTHVRTVRMKPGKPLLFGTRGNTLVFGLPGNPGSAFVGFELFARPALRLLAGHALPGPTVVSLPLAGPLAASNDRPTYHPAKLEGASVRPLPWGGAPDLRGLVPADALLALPAGDVRYNAGDPVPVVLV